MTNLEIQNLWYLVMALPLRVYPAPAWPGSSSINISTVQKMLNNTMVTHSFGLWQLYSFSLIPKKRFKMMAMSKG